MLIKEMTSKCRISVNLFCERSSKC